MKNETGSHWTDAPPGHLFKVSTKIKTKTNNKALSPYCLFYLSLLWFYYIPPTPFWKSGGEATRCKATSCEKIPEVNYFLNLFAKKMTIRAIRTKPAPKRLLSGIGVTWKLVSSHLALP